MGKIPDRGSQHNPGTTTHRLCDKTCWVFKQQESCTCSAAHPEQPAVTFRNSWAAVGASECGPPSHRLKYMSHSAHRRLSALRTNVNYLPTVELRRDWTHFFVSFILLRIGNSSECYTEVSAFVKDQLIFKDYAFWISDEMEIPLNSPKETWEVLVFRFILVSLFFIFC